MEKQYNEELIMHLVKALECALPEGMNVVVGGSATLSEEEALGIIHDLSSQVGKNNNVRAEWIPDEEEEEEEVCGVCKNCDAYQYDCDGVTNEDDLEDCCFEMEENTADVERIRSLLAEVAELMADLT